MAVIDTDLNIQGHLTARTMKIPSGTLTNDGVNGSAAIAATKIQKPRLVEYPTSGTATSATVPIYVCNGATATVMGIKAGSIAACIGGATVTVDLRKNGSTILSAVITLDSGNTARIMEAGTISNSSLVAADFLELVIVATTGGGTLATGLLVQVEIHEDQP